MPTKLSRHAALLKASAAARGYPFVERAALWEERLSMHLNDLDAMLRAPEPGDMLPLPARAKPEVVPAGIEAAAASGRESELGLASAGQIASDVRRGALSPMEVADAMLARIERRRADNAFTCVRPEQVREDARALAARIAQGEDPGPLAGVPVAVKDLMHVRGYPRTCGTKAMAAVEAARDAEAVARLRAAGALIVGMTNLHELAYGVTSANVHFGAVRNPAAPGHLPGGSSGGSGAAVAAGLAAIAVGTDTGGSIRIPAACCGVVGFKPTYDAVSREGVWPLAWTLDHIGPLARSAGDAALAFEAMAGLPAGCVSGKRIERPRLVRPEPYFFDHLQEPVRASIERALAQLAAAGAQIEPRWVEGIEYAPSTQFLTLCTEACQANWGLLTQRPDGLAEDVRLRLEVGQFIAGIDYVKAQRLRRWLRDNLVGALQGADALVLPTLPVSIPRQATPTLEIAGRVLPVASALTRLTSPFNFSGLPALSLPCGQDAHGLPVSLQLVGRPGADASVLAVARWCEDALATGARRQ
jgi:Asp-tRNA(Asn)/Glu-tRNA(Gln) amidotransferase A subunit family amidase